MGKGSSKGQPKVIWPGFDYKAAPRRLAQVGRNDPCPCGSGKKYKHCHEADGAAFLERIALEQDKARWRERRGRAKGEGSPWRRRIMALFGRRPRRTGGEARGQ